MGAPTSVRRPDAHCRTDRRCDGHRVGDAPTTGSASRAEDRQPRQERRAPAGRSSTASKARKDAPPATRIQAAPTQGTTPVLSRGPFASAARRTEPPPSAAAPRRPTIPRRPRAHQPVAAPVPRERGGGHQGQGTRRAKDAASGSHARAHRHRRPQRRGPAHRQAHQPATPTRQHDGRPSDDPRAEASHPPGHPRRTYTDHETSQRCANHQEKAATNVSSE